MTSACIRALARALRLLALCAVLLAPIGWDRPAWSPDSQAFIAHGEPDGTGSALALLDVSGRFVRWIAKPQALQGGSAQAAWSPDGSRIAYVHFEQRLVGEPGAVTGMHYTRTVFVQDAVSGEDRALLSTEHLMPLDEFEGLAAMIPLATRWIGGSGPGQVELATPEPLLVDMDGKSRKMLLPQGASADAVPAPDGKRLAYFTAAPTDGFKDLMIAGPGLPVRAVARLGLVPPKAPAGPEPDSEGFPDTPHVDGPVWTADGRFILAAGSVGTADGKAAGIAYRVNVAAGTVATVWQRESARPQAVSASADGSVVGISYRFPGAKGGGAAVVWPDAGKAVDVFASHETAPDDASVSPDGRWLACPVEADKLTILLIATGTGEVRVCPVDRHPPDRTLAVLRERAMANLEAMGVPDALRKARPVEDAPLAAEDLPLFTAALDAKARDYPAPVQQQAIEYARALTCLAMLKSLPAEQGAALQRRAGGHLDAFLAGQSDAEQRQALRPALWKDLGLGEPPLAPPAAPAGASPPGA